MTTMADILVEKIITALFTHQSLVSMNARRTLAHINEEFLKETLRNGDRVLSNSELPPDCFTHRPTIVWQGPRPVKVITY